MRQLWGYDIIHKKRAAKFHNVNTIEVTDWPQDFQDSNILGDSSIDIRDNGSVNYTLPWKGTGRVSKYGWTIKISMALIVILIGDLAIRWIRPNLG